MRVWWSDVEIIASTYDAKKIIFGEWKCVLWPLWALQSNGEKRSKKSMNVCSYWSSSITNHFRKNIFQPCFYMILVLNLTLYLIYTCIMLSRSYIEFCTAPPYIMSTRWSLGIFRSTITDKWVYLDQMLSEPLLINNHVYPD